MAERQSAVYSLQRRLKAGRQQLESKELHLGLLQKKVNSLEERLLTCSHREGDWEAATVKVGTDKSLVSQCVLQMKG